MPMERGKEPGREVERAKNKDLILGRQGQRGQAFQEDEELEGELLRAGLESLEIGKVQDMGKVRYSLRSNYATRLEVI